MIVKQLPDNMHHVRRSISIPEVDRRNVVGIRNEFIEISSLFCSHAREHFIGQTLQLVDGRELFGSPEYIARALAGGGEFLEIAANDEFIAATLEEVEAQNMPDAWDDFDY